MADQKKYIIGTRGSLLAVTQSTMILNQLTANSDAIFEIKTIKTEGDLKTDKPWFLSGGINSNNISKIIEDINPLGIDLSSGVEKELGIKDNHIINNFIEKLNYA